MEREGRSPMETAPPLCSLGLSEGALLSGALPLTRFFLQHFKGRATCSAGAKGAGFHVCAKVKFPACGLTP